MSGVGGCLCVASLVAIVWIAAPAAAQVATLRPPPGPSLQGGPVLAGERVAWSQLRCVRACGSVEPGETGRYEVLREGPDGRRRLFSARTHHAASGPRNTSRRFSFLLSEQTLVTARSTSAVDEYGDEYGGVALRAGWWGAAGDLIAACSAPDFSGIANVALDGSRLAYDPEPCDGEDRLVVRDLATGALTRLPEPAGGAHLRLRGRYAAWVEGHGDTARLVVHDVVAGAGAYSTPAPGVQQIDLDADGTVAGVTGQGYGPCSPGRLTRWSAAQPGPEDLGVPACGAERVRIEDGVIFFVGWNAPAKTLRAHAPEGAVRDLVRYGRVLTHGFDVSGERLAWAVRQCDGGEAIFAGRVSAPPAAVGSSDCRARFRSGIATVRGGVATVRLRCPRGCWGDLALRHVGGNDFFSLRPGKTELRVRLRRRARLRLERRGVLEVHAVLATYDRAHDRQVRRRALRLVLRR
jgi:hypothetical protein